MFSAFIASDTVLLTVRNATARFFTDGDVVDGLRSVDGRRFGDAVFDLVECCRDGVDLTLLSVNGTFDILLMPSFLLRFCALSRHRCTNENECKIGFETSDKDGECKMVHTHTKMHQMTFELEHSKKF